MGLPSAYQKFMKAQGFDETEETIDALIKFVTERCEGNEDLNPPVSTKPKNDSTATANATTKGKGKRKSGGDKEADGSKAKKKRGLNCLIHGENCGHDSGQCLVLKKLAEEDKKKFKRGGSKNTRDNQPSRDEIHSIVKECVQEESNAIIRNTCRAVMKEYERKRAQESDDAFMVDVQDRIRDKLNLAQDILSDNDSFEACA